MLFDDDGEDAGLPAARPAGPQIHRISGVGCLVGLLMIPLGVVAAYVDVQLVYAARVYCDAGAEPPHLFVLNLEMLPRYLVGPALAFVSFIVVGIPGLVSPLGRSRIGGRVVTVLAVMVALAAVGGMIVYDFANLGTLNGHPGDSGECGPDNVPPWWPTWLPS